MKTIRAIVCALAVGLLVTGQTQAGPQGRGPAKRGRLTKGGKRKLGKKPHRGPRRPGRLARPGRFPGRRPPHAHARPFRRPRPGRDEYRRPRHVRTYEYGRPIIREPRIVIRHEHYWVKPRKKRPVVRDYEVRRSQRAVFVRGWSKRAEYVQGANYIDEGRLRTLSKGWHEVAATRHGHRVEVQVKDGKIAGMKFRSESGTEYPTRCWKENGNLCFGACDPKTGQTSCVRWPVKWCADECEPEDGPPEDDDEGNQAPGPKNGKPQSDDTVGEE